MPSLRRLEGVLMVDHRASPGLPKDFYKPLGIDAPPVVGEGKMLEMATFTCSHCKGVVVINPERKRERAYCIKCDKFICDHCHAISTLPGYSHTPFDKLEDVIAGSDKHDNVTLLLSQLKGKGV